MRLIAPLFVLSIVAGCASDPRAPTGNDEARFVTGSNIPRHGNPTSSDHVVTGDRIDSSTSGSSGQGR